MVSASLPGANEAGIRMPFRTRRPRCRTIFERVAPARGFLSVHADWVKEKDRFRLTFRAWSLKVSLLKRIFTENESITCLARPGNRHWE